LNTLIGHPFDLTKTRLQTAAPGAYKGAIDVVKKTVAQDGLTGCANCVLLTHEMNIVFDIVFIGEWYLRYLELHPSSQSLSG